MRGADIVLGHKYSPDGAKKASSFLKQHAKFQQVLHDAKPLFDELRDMELHASGPAPKVARVKTELPIKKENDAYVGQVLRRSRLLVQAARTAVQ